MYGLPLNACGNDPASLRTIARLIGIVGVSAALVLGFTASARAQGTDQATFVTNLGQTSSGATSQTTNKNAQAFTTGSREGYVLQSIELRMDALPTIGGSLTVDVRTNASGNPGNTVLFTLQGPSSFSVSTPSKFTVLNSRGTWQLDPNATYFAVASFSPGLNANSTRWKTPASNGQSGYNGWAIANDAHYYANNGWQTSTDAMQIRVKGKRKSKPTVADETVTIGEDTGHTFEAANFNFSDADGDTLRKVRITDLPGKGTLSLDDAAIDSVPTQITKAEFDAQEFKYTPAPDGSEAGKLDVADNVTGVDEASTADPADVTVIA